MTNPRTEVITSVERRRRWPRVEKERLVAASLEPGASVSEVARSAGLHVSQLFKWRKELCKRSATSIAGLVPVEIVPSPPKQVEEPSTAAAKRRRKKDGIIEIELGSGDRVWVDCDVDGDALRRVLDALARR
jgi:transposase